MTLKRRFFSAPTLTQALLAAARHHSVDPDALDYKVVEKKTGFIKAPRGVVIDVDPDAPVKAGADAERPSSPTPSPPTAEPAPTETAPSDTEPNETTAEPPAAHAAEVPFAPAAGDAPAEHPALAAVDAPRAEAAEAPAAETPAADAAPSEEEAEAPVEAAAQTVEAARETPAEVASSSPFGDPPAEDDEPAADEPVAPSFEAPRAAPTEAPSAAGPADDELRETVAEAIDELAFLASLRVQVAEVRSSDDGLEVELDGPDSERLAARGGRALLAMQHLLPRLLFGRLGKAPRCRVDCDGFHAARAERLDRLAQKAADRVRKGGRSWLLEPMAPDERRLVHLALAEVPDMETESVGEGFLKRVRVAQVESAGSSSG